MAEAFFILLHPVKFVMTPSVAWSSSSPTATADADTRGEAVDRKLLNASLVQKLRMAY